MRNEKLQRKVAEQLYCGLARAEANMRQYAQYRPIYKPNMNNTSGGHTLLHTLQSVAQSSLVCNRGEQAVSIAHTTLGPAPIARGLAFVVGRGQEAPPAGCSSVALRWVRPSLLRII